jgi:CheY-like chemotaxis protein
MSPEKQPTILIVDDEEMLRKAIAFDFKRKGFEVLEADSGRMAFEISENHNIDIILSDIRMPDGDGLSLLHKIKDRNPTKPVVFLMTGYADITDEDAYQLGADAILNKPFDRKQLMAMVREHLLPDLQKWRATDVDELANTFKLQMTVASIESSIEMQLLNIGRGGFFAAFQGVMPRVGSTISYQLNFTNESFKSISGQGLVRWVRHQHSTAFPSGCGVEFTSMDQNDRELVVELIAKLHRKSFIPKI